MLATSSTSPEPEDGVSFGDMAPDEVEFVMDSLAKSYRSSPWAGVVPNNLWFPVCRAAVTGLLERGAMVTVARAAGRVLGYVIHEHKGPDVVLHMVYVKDPFRRTGLARRLLTRCGAYGAERVFYTFKTRSAPLVLKGLRSTYAPEIARRREL